MEERIDSTRALILETLAKSLSLVLPCEVTRIRDGDTIEVTALGPLDMSRRKVAVRLIGVNCPERNAEGGKEATLATIGWVTEMTGVTQLALTAHEERDRYGRYLGDLITMDGHSLIQHLLETGNATPWQVTKTSRNFVIPPDLISNG